MLSRLAAHFYRPDFTEGQAKSIIHDMVEDLSDYSEAAVEAAIKAYRQTPPPPGKAKYFPDSGTLRKLAQEATPHSVFARGEPEKPVIPEFGEQRPICWWMKSPYLWEPHWQESEIPEAHQPAFRRRLNMKRANGEPGWSIAEFAGYRRKYPPPKPHEEAAE